MKISSAAHSLLCLFPSLFLPSLFLPSSPSLSCIDFPSITSSFTQSLSSFGHHHLVLIISRETRVDSSNPLYLSRLSANSPKMVTKGQASSSNNPATNSIPWSKIFTTNSKWEDKVRVAGESLEGMFTS